MKSGKNKLLDNWGLKLISLTLAFILWFVVISIDDPVDTKSFSNIKVNLLNTEALTEKGMVWEILDGTDVLRSISFDAPDSVRKVIEASDFVAEADLNDVTIMNTVAIKITCPKYSNQVTNISGNISNVKLSIEDKKSKWIDIKSNLIGEVAEGYVIGGISLEQNRLEIEGPESKINEITNAVVDVNVADISRAIDVRVDIHLKDAEGNTLTYENVTKNTDTVKVSVDIHGTKEVPIEYYTMGVPAEGYLATGVVEATPTTIVISGASKILTSTNRIVVPAEEINITGATANLSQMVDLKEFLPDGISFVDKEFDGKAYVTVYVEEIAEKVLSLKKENLTIVNAPEGYVLSFPENLNMPVITLAGLQADLETIDEVMGTLDIAAWMDAQDIEVMESGLYAIPVNVELPEGVEIEDKVSVYIEFATPEEIEARAFEEQQEQGGLSGVGTVQ